LLRTLAPPSVVPVVALSPVPSRVSGTARDTGALSALVVIAVRNAVESLIP
jgi:hypothetical protein